MGPCCHFVERNLLFWQQPGLFEDSLGTTLANNSTRCNSVPVLEDPFDDKRCQNKEENYHSTWNLVIFKKLSENSVKCHSDNGSLRFILMHEGYQRKRRLLCIPIMSFWNHPESHYNLSLDIRSHEYTSHYLHLLFSNLMKHLPLN